MKFIFDKNAGNLAMSHTTLGNKFIYKITIKVLITYGKIYKSLNSDMLNQNTTYRINEHNFGL